MRRLLARLFGTRYRLVRDPRELQAGQLVELRGRAEAVEPLVDPLEDRPCIAIEYRAWPPSTTVGIDGATSHGARAFQVAAHQATDFTLGEAPRLVLVKVQRGDDLAERHQALVARYGVGLRAETHVIPLGTDVVIRGKVLVGFDAGASPHRSDPHVATVRADQYWPAEA